VTVVAILIVAGLAVGIWGLQTLVGKTVSTVDRAVRKKTLVAGRAEVNAGLSITAPVRSAVLVGQIISTVNAHASAPALVAGLYLKHQTETLAQFAFGSKTHGDAFGAVVRLSDVDAGCRGDYEILHWTESGADVQGKKEMTRLRGRIEDAVRAASGATEAA
jgi:hypothetical protein